MSEEPNCEQCAATGFEHPCECCEHCKAHGCWLGADCTCGNEKDLQLTALMEEVRAWRRVWTELCGEFYSQQENMEYPDLAMIIDGNVINEGQDNVIRLNNIFGGLLPMVKERKCEPCDYDWSPVLDGTCLVCGSPVED